MILKDLIENPKLLENLEFTGTRCKFCGVKLSIETTEYVHEVENGFSCDDCYFEKMGEEIEKHPICSPRFRK